MNIVIVGPASKQTAPNNGKSVDKKDKKSKRDKTAVTSVTGEENIMSERKLTPEEYASLTGDKSIVETEKAIESVNDDSISLAISDAESTFVNTRRSKRKSALDNLPSEVGASSDEAPVNSDVTQTVLSTASEESSVASDSSIKTSITKRRFGLRKKNPQENTPETQKDSFKERSQGPKTVKRKKKDKSQKVDNDSQLIADDVEPDTTMEDFEFFEEKKTISYGLVLLYMLALVGSLLGGIAFATFSVTRIVSQAMGG